MSDRNLWLSPQFFLCRWRLALKTLPMVAAMIGFRFAVWYGAGVGGWVDPSVFTSFIVLAVFVSAVMLQGVIQDFKESEKMPSELQSAFWSLTSELEKARKCVKPPLGDEIFMQKGLKCVAEMLLCIIKVLDCGNESPDRSFETTSEAMRSSEVNLFALFHDYKVKPKKIAKPIEIIRKTLGRMYVIQATSYIPQCYTLMDSMVLIVFTLMTTANWPKETTAFETAIAFTVIITFLFSFLWLMVRSLEDPFEYPPQYNMKCFSDPKNSGCQKIEMGLDEEFVSVGSIDMSVLTVGFGKNLRDLLTKYNIDNFWSNSVSLPQNQKKTASGHCIQNETTSVYEKYLRRWNIFAFTLPAIGAMIGFRMAVWYGANVDGWIPPQTFTSFISLTVFVTALLLQGLIQDYKESEKMPSDLLNAFQGLTAAIQSAYSSAFATAKNKSEPKDLPDKLRKLQSTYLKALKDIEVLLLVLTQILDSKGDDVADEIFDEATKTIREKEKDLFVYLINSQAFDVIASAAKPLATIRNLAGRINVIKKTSYILAGYSLADKMILIVFILMTLSKWPVDTKWTVAISYTVVITFLFSYLAILIRKVEDPFTNPKNSPNFNVECYKSGDYEQKDHIDGLGCIDMSAVTIVFGRQLSALLQEAKTLQNQPDQPDQACGLPIKSSAIESESASDIMEFPSAKYLLKRWRIAIFALPLVIVLVAARMVVWYGVGVGGWIDPSVFTSFIGIVIFVAVILIQGIVQDYKEAEKIPSELFSAFEGLATAVQIAHEVGLNRDYYKGEITLSSSAAHIEKILIAVLHVVENGDVAAYEYAMNCIQEAEVSLNDDLCRLNAHNGGASAAIEAIVKITGRLHVIQATSYISAGYALMNLSLCLVLALMTASNWPTSTAMPVAIAYTVVITYLYTYLRLMISDLEDPFEFPERYCLQCYVSGEVLPISEWQEFRKGGSISSLSMLTVIFGKQLKSLMKDDITRIGNSDQQKQQSSGNALQRAEVISTEADLSEKVQTLIRFYGIQTDDERDADEERAPGQQSDLLKLRPEKPESVLSAINVKNILAHWRLALRCIPVVTITVGMRLAVWYGAGIGGWIDQVVFTSFISLAIFVSAIVIQGLLQDYKEAEKMPSELASAFYALTGAVEINRRWAQVTKEMAGPSSAMTIQSPIEPLQKVHNALLAVFKVLELPDGGSAPFVYSQAMVILDEAQTFLSCKFADLEKSVDKDFELLKNDKNKLLVYPGAKFDKPFDRLRAVLSRMYAIQKTSYILEGYTLMDLMMAAVAALMTAVDWSQKTSEGTAMAFTVSITFLFAYLQFLVRDLEDPFKYPEKHSETSFTGGEYEFTYFEDHLCGGSINLNPLTVAFGTKLKSLLFKYSVVKEIDFKDFVQDSLKKISDYSNSSIFNAVEDGKMVYLIQRFRLVLQTVPLVLCMVALRFAVWRGASVSGWIEPAVFTSFVGLVIFVTSLLVQGVVADYKEAEKLPCQLAASMQSLKTAVSLGCKLSATENKDSSIRSQAIKSMTRKTDIENNVNGAKGGNSIVMTRFAFDSFDLESLTRWCCLFHVQSILEHLLRVLDVGESEVESKSVFDEAMRAIQEAELGICEIFKTEKGYSDGAWDAVGPLLEVRQALGRIYVIKQTSFTLDGYSLSDGMLLAILVLLALSKWPEDTYMGTALSTTVILSGLFIYLALLIRSLEDPFKYPIILESSKASKSGIGYCIGLYRSIQHLPASITSLCPSEGAHLRKEESIPMNERSMVLNNLKVDYIAPAFGWLAAFYCGNPIDLSVLAQGFGYQMHQSFGKMDPSQQQDVMTIVKPWLGRNFFKSAFKFELPAPALSSPALLDEKTRSESRFDVSSNLVWPLPVDSEASKSSVEMKHSLSVQSSQLQGSGPTNTGDSSLSEARVLQGNNPAEASSQIFLHNAARGSDDHIFCGAKTYYAGNIVISTNPHDQNLLSGRA